MCPDPEVPTTGRGDSGNWESLNIVGCEVQGDEAT